ncbi:hypothetical protein ACKVWC_010481 [Pyricularia oryzae]|uniref:AVR-Rmg8 protein n=1 Tax=Pyricularia oryzae TaxID=318829 RepID=A0A286T6A2_PYROR|nr:AVR-Rmg8 protein [Pyricularia oryzae]UJG81365.1 AVR-Rmg8 protein [Pyricularia oryzae]UJG81366.1 AVR-Rmg8 protein [Pyricularia oryzae]BBA31636.1 AVR-Rmg8 [Pyricularia oryzae]
MHRIGFFFPILIAGAMALPAPQPMPPSRPGQGGRGGNGGRGPGGPPPQQYEEPVPYHQTAAAAWQPYPGHVPGGQRPTEHSELIPDDYPQFVKDYDTYFFGGLPGTRRQ